MKSTPQEGSWETWTTREQAMQHAGDLVLVKNPAGKELGVGLVSGGNDQLPQGGILFPHPQPEKFFVNVPKDHTTFSPFNYVELNADVTFPQDGRKYQERMTGFEFRVLGENTKWTNDDVRREMEAWMRRSDVK